MHGLPVNVASADTKAKGQRKVEPQPLPELSGNGSDWHGGNDESGGEMVLFERKRGRKG